MLVCTKEAIDQFSIGISEDLGEHFAPLLHLAEVEPRACAADASANVCALEWKDIATTIGVDAGTPDAGERDAAAAPRGCGCALGQRRVAERNAVLLVLAVTLGGAIGRARARRAPRSRRH